MVTEGTNPQYLGGVGQVRYAGPTTGKSTFIKANPDSGLVDLDVVPGYKQLRKDIANQLGLDWKDPKVTDSPEYQQAFNNFIRDWAQNTENTGKTLFGSAKGLLRGDNPLTGQPFIPDFETFVARNQARGFKENPEQLRAWYNSIVDSYPEIKIDNRFVGEIPFYSAPKTSVKSIQLEEPIMGRGPGRPKKSSTEALISPEAWDEMLFEDMIGEQGAINAARKASQAGKRVLKPITDAEKLGIPKSSRSDPRALEDPYYWGYEQWNQRYNDAVNSENVREAQRLRDLHFKHKSNATPEVVYRGESEDVTNFILGSGTKRPGISFTSESPAVAVSYADITSPYGKIEVLPQQIDARQKWIEMARKQGILTSEQEMLALQDIENKKVALTAALQEANSFSHPQLRKLYIYPKNSKTIDAMGANWKYVTDTQSGLKGVPTDMHAFNAKNNGFDALRIKNVFDIGKGGYNIKSNDVVILDSKIAKLADPITKTNTGEIIPIVKRDNFHNPDIRYKQGGKINLVRKCQK